MLVSVNTTSFTVDNALQNTGSWWNRRTHLEQKLYLILLFTLIILTGLTASTIWFFLVKKNLAACKTCTTPVSSTNKTSGVNNNVCLTSGCILAASTLIQNMDSTVNPCDDFYQYACGGFLKSKYIKDTKVEVDQLSDLREKLKQQLKDIVEEVNKPTDSELQVKIKDFYASCMNLTKIREIGLKPLKEIIKQVGGWPVVMGDDWKSTNFTWQKLMFAFKQAKISPSAFIIFGVTEHLKEEKHLIVMTAPYYPIPKSELELGLNNTRTRIYYKYLIKTAEFFGANSSRATKEMRDVLDFILEISKLLPPDERNPNMTELYTSMKLSEIQKILPEVNWKMYLETIQPNKISSDELIYVMDFNYTMNFTKLLLKYDSRTLANYAVGQLAHTYAIDLSEEFQKISFNTYQELSGVTQDVARWRYCLSDIESFFTIGLGHEYIKKFVSPQLKPEIQELVSLIRNSMHKLLKNTSWLDAVTLNRALEKLNNTDEMIGYPDELQDYTAVAEIYENLTINKENYFENVLNGRQLYRDEEWSYLRKPVIKRDWKDRADVIDVNAYYSGDENSIILPVGILQELIFDINRPQYMNFGILGGIVGHELTHGFDDQGRQFDKDGKLVDWWDQETSKHFQDKAECMINQYNTYVIPEVNMTLNGKNTIGENIADNGGVKAAYLAYQEWVKTHEEELTLPLLNLTSNQLFWISYANVWCTKTRPEIMKDLIQYEVHAIAKFRVNGPLANMHSFSDDFQCPKESPLNPKQKCSVW